MRMIGREKALREKAGPKIEELPVICTSYSVETMSFQGRDVISLGGAQSVDGGRLDEGKGRDSRFAHEDIRVRYARTGSGGVSAGEQLKY